MHIKPFNQTLQDFVRVVSCEKSNSINTTNASEQEHMLDYLIQLMQYCVRFDQNNIPKELHLHPEFFALPNVETFFTSLFDNLHESLFPKAKNVFLQGLSFIVKYIGLPKSREVMYGLMEKLQNRFPTLKEMHDKAIENFIEEFFRPTIGEFLDKYKVNKRLLQIAFPTIYELFVTPLDTVHDRKLFNFYCNPWIYQPIMDYLAKYPQSNEAPLNFLEDRLQAIHASTTTESWEELSKKAHNLCTHSSNLEQFAIACCGLLGEIKTAAQIRSKGTVIFLPEKSDEGKNCDLLVIDPIGKLELIECKAKTPRHGLEETTAGVTQIWDDFFTNFSLAIHSYVDYHQKAIQNPLGFSECFPLLSAFEGSSYAQALPLIQSIPSTTGNVTLKKWTAEQKISHLLRALFLRPLVLDPCCVPLPPEEERLTQRQQATETTIKNKEWVISIFNKATKQLEDTYHRLTAEGQTVNKLLVALDLELSYRLLHDHFSYNNGNIAEVAEQALYETFEPYRTTFAKKNLNLGLLLIQP
ncbi:hypothetical protein [Waddlia chondrophila]|uniref:hypothetical protein n=1 Tax=Waddlia chondrophila TaxID=71667 RepID=UPI000A8DCB6B|nr:hypothetical protein [Waddlia chondrophila]